jgi:hypothetical protein
MLDRLYIQDLQKELRYRDRRTILRWCYNHEVGLFSDIGTKRLYAIKEEFEAAKNKQALNYIDQKYKTDSLPDINKHTFKTTKTHLTLKEKATDTYQPQGEHEKNFLNYLQKI